MLDAARTRSAIVSAVLASFLAGCAAEHASSRSAAPLVASARISKAVAAPCKEVPPMNYPPPKESASPVEPKLGYKAIDTKRNGCAGVKFQIAADGSVYNAELVSEYPTGLGFGDTTLEALNATRFGPDQPKTDWVYVNAVYVQLEAPPGRIPYLDPTLTGPTAFDRNPNRP